MFTTGHLLVNIQSLNVGLSAPDHADIKFKETGRPSGRLLKLLPRDCLRHIGLNIFLRQPAVLRFDLSP